MRSGKKFTDLVDVASFTRDFAQAKQLAELIEGIEIFDVFGNKVPVLSDGSWIFDFSPIPYYIVAKDSESLNSFLNILK